MEWMEADPVVLGTWAWDAKLTSCQLAVGSSMGDLSVFHCAFGHCTRSFSRVTGPVGVHCPESSTVVEVYYSYVRT